MSKIKLAKYTHLILLHLSFGSLFQPYEIPSIIARELQIHQAKDISQVSELQRHILNIEKSIFSKEILAKESSSKASILVL